MTLPAVFADLLKQTMGLDATAIGTSAIEHAVRERMTACSLPDARAYEAHLLSSESELQALIEAAVVPETWFFRDAAAFVEMVRALQAAPQRAEAGRIRLLSLPCSTGEEPYSMAMALLEAGIPGDRFRVDAIDISARNIAYAGRAVYGKNSFRGSDLAFRERHFERIATGYRVSEAVREVVHFRQENMFASDFLPQVGIYDIVFCRNLLVYFDRPTQTRAIGILRRLLADDGTAFVGPAEAGMMFNHAFVWSKTPLAFSFQKERAAPKPEPRVPTVAPPRPLPIRHTPRPRAPVLPALRERRSSDLSEATTLADAGRFIEAADICKHHLRAHGSSAPAFHLLGLISDAAGETADAILYFKKALYLDCEHAASLVHLALLLEKRGDIAGARLLRERLRRQQRDIGAAR